MIDSLIEIAKFLVANWEIALTAVVGFVLALGALCTAGAALFVLIPGPQPEGFLYMAADKLNAIGAWLEKFSRK